MTAVWISTSLIGFTISTFFNSLRHVWPMASILSMVLSLLPPIYYPATVLPHGWQWIGALTPTGASAMILHQVAGLVEVEATALVASIASLAAYAVTLLLSSLKVRWRER
jgi:ABC-2 type transport system permease protein